MATTRVSASLYRIEAGMRPVAGDRSELAKAYRAIEQSHAELLEALRIIDNYAHPLTVAHASEMKRIARAATQKADGWLLSDGHRAGHG